MAPNLALIYQMREKYFYVIGEYGRPDKVTSTTARLRRAFAYWVDRSPESRTPKTSRLKLEDAYVSNSDIEIARRATMQPITDVAAKLNSKVCAPSDWQQAHQAFANRQETLLKKARSNVDA